jgi:hypothetical protein
MKINYNDNLEFLYDRIEAIEKKSSENYLLLLKELHIAYLEGESYFRQLKRQSRNSFNGSDIIKISAIKAENEYYTETHSHLGFELKKVDYLLRSWTYLHVRLLLHHGKPGILFFNSQVPPLNSWSQDGIENGQSFKLFIPHDQKSMNELVRALGSDLFFVKEIACKIYLHLIDHRSEGNSINWSVVASQLISQIEELPERMHYDDVKTSFNNDEIRFRLFNIALKNEFYSSLIIDWNPRKDEITLYFENLVKPLFTSLLSQRATEAGSILYSVRTPHRWVSHQDAELLKLIINEIPNLTYHLKKQSKELPFQKFTLFRSLRNLQKNIKI